MMKDGFSSVLETEVKLQGILNAFYNKETQTRMIQSWESLYLSLSLHTNHKNMFTVHPKDSILFFF